MRATFGGLGARVLTSPYRVIASVYWFAAQALTAAFGVQAIVVALADRRPSLVPTALAIAVVQAAVAALGFDVMRWLLRIVLPLSVATAGVLLGLWLVSDDPRVRGRARARLARPGADVGRLRDGRHRDVRLVADARHEHRRPDAGTRAPAVTCGSA